MKNRYYVTILNYGGTMHELIEADDILFKENSIIFVENGGSTWIYLKVFPASKTIINKIEPIKK